MGSCSSGSGAGCLVIGRSLVQIPAELSCMLKCHWARHCTPNCSWCVVGTLYHGHCHQSMCIYLNVSETSAPPSDVCFGSESWRQLMRADDWNIILQGLQSGSKMMWAQFFTCWCHCSHLNSSLSSDWVSLNPHHWWLLIRNVFVLKFVEVPTIISTKTQWGLILLPRRQMYFNISR